MKTIINKMKTLGSFKEKKERLELKVIEIGKNTQQLIILAMI